jgi:hypothetical protein
MSWLPAGNTLTVNVESEGLTLRMHPLRFDHAELWIAEHLKPGKAWLFMFCRHQQWDHGLMGCGWTELIDDGDGEQMITCLLPYHHASEHKFIYAVNPAGDGTKLSEPSPASESDTACSLCPV